MVVFAQCGMRIYPSHCAYTEGFLVKIEKRFNRLKKEGEGQGRIQNENSNFLCSSLFCHYHLFHCHSEIAAESRKCVSVEFKAFLNLETSNLSKYSIFRLPSPVKVQATIS